MEVTRTKMVLTFYRLPKAFDHHCNGLQTSRCPSNMLDPFHSMLQVQPPAPKKPISKTGRLDIKKA